MSTHNLKPGDRVRLTAQQLTWDCQPGDKGMVLRELLTSPNGTRYYLVRMDKDEPGKTGVVCTADEIEPEV
jgi:hypothetical protein